MLTFEFCQFIRQAQAYAELQAEIGTYSLWFPEDAFGSEL